MPISQSPTGEREGAIPREWTTPWRPASVAAGGHDPSPVQCRRRIAQGAPMGAIRATPRFPRASCAIHSLHFSRYLVYCIPRFLRRQVLIVPGVGMPVFRQFFPKVAGILHHDRMTRVTAMGGHSARGAVRHDGGPSREPCDDARWPPMAARRVAPRAFWRASAPLADVRHRRRDASTPKDANRGSHVPSYRDRGY